MTSLEKLDILGEDVSELSKDIGSLLDNSSIALKRLDGLVLKEHSEFIERSYLG